MDETGVLRRPADIRIRANPGAHRPAHRVPIDEPATYWSANAGSMARTARDLDRYDGGQGMGKPARAYAPSSSPTKEGPS